MSQMYESAATSLNQVPSLIKFIEKKEELNKDQVLLDYGAGKFNKTREYLKGTHEVSYFPYDPYNRSKEVNDAALAQKADIVMLSNVLNVIREPEERLKVLNQIKSLMKPGARLYVRTYNAPRNENYQEEPYPGQPTKNGTCWQMCQPDDFYMDEVKGVLGNVEKKNGYLLAIK